MTPPARVAKLANAIALKAIVLRDLWVRLPPRALGLFWQTVTETQTRQRTTTEAAPEPFSE